MTRPARQLPYQVVHYIAATYNVDNDASGKVIGTIPANSLIVSWNVNVTEAFTASSTVDIGWTGTTDAVAATAAVIPTSAGAKAAAKAVRVTANTDVILTVSETGNDGKLEVAIAYVPATDVFPVA